MLPIISFVGKSNIGKTTLLVGLIAKLKERGYRVAVVKHVARGFELDQQGKDSWRFAQAGADSVIVSSADRIAVIQRQERDLSLGEVTRHIGEDFDLILTEGFKKGNAPKIELHHRDKGAELLFSPPELIALVTDEHLELPVPQYSWDDLQGIADLIEQTFLKVRRSEDISLFINGAPVPVNEFVQKFLSRTLEGMMSALKGVEQIESLELRLRKRL